MVDGRNIDGTAWRAVSVVGRLPAVGSEPTLRFESGAVRGYGGCNGYTGQGPASIVHGVLDLGDMLMTLGGCLDASGRTTPGGELEPVFFGALSASDRVTFRGGQLVLSGPGGELVFERVP
jgi:heat shock protein HslJ